MEQLKYKIGEFSRLGRVTVRTLRHYGEIGLLKPEIIDRQTSYRYYRARQLQKLLAIVQLKELGSRLPRSGTFTRKIRIFLTSE